MSLRIGRAFEMSNRKPARSASRDRRAPSSGGRKYDRLMQVTITNTYYAGSTEGSGDGHLGGKCPDFQVIPTPATQNLMRRLGLLFRSTSAGFSIAYDTNNQEALFGYLQRQGKRRLEQLRLDKGENICRSKPSEDPYWTRLSFTLVLTNPEFLNFTQLPNFRPCEKNLYFTNRRARPEDIDSGASFDRAIWPSRAGSCLQIVPVKGPANVPLSVNEVEVQDIAGTPVMPAAYRWDPKPGQSPQPSYEMFLDFSRLPEDKYTICWQGGKEQVLYTSAAPLPLCFVDLLFSHPSGARESRPAASDASPAADSSAAGEAGGLGVYPVHNLATEQPWTRPVHYQLRFQARSTRWVYYVIEQRQSQRFERHYGDLEITQVAQVAANGAGEKTASGEAGKLHFCRSRDMIPVGRGRKAHRFVSNQPIELRRNSGQRFELRRGGVQEPLLSPLPVATAQQLFSSPLPPVDEAFGQDAGESEYSHIYVYI